MPMPTVELEVDVEFFTGLECAEINLLDTRVRAVDFHTDAVADEYADHRVDDTLPECSADPDRDALAGRYDAAGAAGVIEQFHVEDFARAVAMAIGRSGMSAAIALFEGLLAFEDDTDVLVDHVLGLPSASTRPFRRKMARFESCLTRPRSWETNRTVIFLSRSSSNLRMQRLANTASPTASASSTIRMSGLTWMAVENASRTYIPLEYSLTGR